MTIAASLDFFDHGQPRIQLTASSDGSALLRMADDGDENRLALFLRKDGTTGQAFENPKRGFLVGVQPDGMAGLCVVDERGRELDRLGFLPDELQCVRMNHVIYGTVPGPFRTRGAPDRRSSRSAPALDRQADRADESIKAGHPLAGRIIATVDVTERAPSAARSHAETRQTKHLRYSVSRQEAETG